MKHVFLLLLSGILMSVPSTDAFATPVDFVLVASTKNSINSLKPDDVKRLYKGRLSSVKGQALRPLNAPQGSADRAVFLQRLLNMSEPDYTGYWYVRQYSGQGSPPKELASLAELLVFLKSQPEAIGYLAVSQDEPLTLPKELKIIKVQ